MQSIIAPWPRAWLLGGTFPKRTKTQYSRTKNPENPENAGNTPERLVRRRVAFEFQCFRHCTLSSYLIMLMFCLWLQKTTGFYFSFSHAFNRPGKTVKIVAYPKWRRTCVAFSDVQVNFCCVPRNIFTLVWITVLLRPPTLVDRPLYLTFELIKAVRHFLSFFVIHGHSSETMQRRPVKSIFTR